MALGKFEGTDWCQEHLNTRAKLEAVHVLSREDLYAVGGAYMHKYPESSWSHDPHGRQAAHKRK